MLLAESGQSHLIQYDIKTSKDHHQTMLQQVPVACHQAIEEEVTKMLQNSIV